MKKTILAIAMTLSAFSANAMTCEQLDSIAGGIMEARQSGVALSDIKGKFEEAGFWDDFKGLVIDAYSKTRWNSESNQERAVIDFKNDYYILCLELENDN